jgi:hypothetical protein
MISPKHAPQNRPVVSTTEARSGVTGHNVRYVLLFGVLAAIVAFVVLYAVFFAHHS